MKNQRSNIFPVLIFSLLAHISFAQSNEITGLIFRRLETHGDNQVDYFLKAELDSTKSLYKNVVKARNDHPY